MSLPGTKAQLKPSFVKKGKAGDEVKKEKAKEAKASDGEDEELTETERSAKVKDWLKNGTRLWTPSTRIRYWSTAIHALRL